MLKFEPRGRCEACGKMVDFLHGSSRRWGWRWKRCPECDDVTPAKEKR
jgi:hypothetical protein